MIVLKDIKIQRPDASSHGPMRYETCFIWMKGPNGLQMGLLGYDVWRIIWCIVLHIVAIQSSSAQISPIFDVCNETSLKEQVAYTFLGEFVSSCLYDLLLMLQKVIKNQLINSTNFNKCSFSVARVIYSIILFIFTIA